MQKDDGWGSDFDESRRTDDWQFQWYWPDGSINTAENTARCQSCHQSRSDSQYMFTFSDAQGFEG
jgi:hypothetical protein